MRRIFIYRRNLPVLAGDIRIAVVAVVVEDIVQGQLELAVCQALVLVGQLVLVQPQWEAVVARTGEEPLVLDQVAVDMDQEGHCHSLDTDQQRLQVLLPVPEYFWRIEKSEKDETGISKSHRHEGEFLSKLCIPFATIAVRWVPVRWWKLSWRLLVLLLLRWTILIWWAILIIALLSLILRSCDKDNNTRLRM